MPADRRVGGDAYIPGMYDSNLNWVKVTVARQDEVARVHAALSNTLVRPGLRAPIGDVIVVEFNDQHARDGAGHVQAVLAQEFGSPDWIRVEVGHGNAKWIYGDP
jgi:hypothetical protein